MLSNPVSVSMKAFGVFNWLSMEIIVGIFASKLCQTQFSLSVNMNNMNFQQQVA